MYITNFQVGELRALELREEELSRLLRYLELSLPKVKQRIKKYNTR